MTATSAIPEFTQLLRAKSMIRYLPANGTAGLARFCERRLNRSPWPPARITASTLLMACSSFLWGVWIFKVIPPCVNHYILLRGLWVRRTGVPLVILSAAKDLSAHRERSFAALRMTPGDRFVSPRLNAWPPACTKGGC